MLRSCDQQVSTSYLATIGNNIDRVEEPAVEAKKAEGAKLGCTADTQSTLLGWERGLVPRPSH